jgi:hypothetical protein
MFQPESGPKDPAETLTWSQLLDRTVQSANLFRSLTFAKATSSPLYAAELHRSRPDSICVVTGHRKP